MIICGAIVAALSLFFKADQIFVTGASRYSQQQVLQASGIRQGGNLFLLNKHQAAAAITDQLPYVESVRIRRQLPNALRIEITEDSPAVEIYNEDGKVGEWDFQNLNRVTESDRIFELCRGGGRSRQYLALPKDALREGTVEEFRSCMDRWLKGDKAVEYYDISERRQKQLMKAKYQLFKH